MKQATQILMALCCAAALALAASPALAGYKHGGHHKHGSFYKHGGYAMQGHAYRVHPRWLAKRHKGWHRHGKYAGPPLRHGHAGYANSADGKATYGKRPAGYRSASPKADGAVGKKVGGAAYATGSAYAAGGYGAAAYTAQPAARKVGDRPADIVSTATAAGSFSTLIAAVEAAGLATTLQGEGPFTVLAPTDAAFAKLPEGTLDALLQDKAALESLLTYHVIPGRLSAADLVEAGEAATVNGAAVTLAQLDVASADVEAANGIIHVLDTVLTPAP